ncbi:MAG: SLBB domain-containing protein [Prevotellaceae bacterium]|jgi:protein involved in polysaccharide export with SLBB domain|nr:SLBB domain-containing protein [Prevotellaceae bacterium]
MKRSIFVFVVFSLFVNVVIAQMTDDQVLNYVKSEHAKGTSQEQIANSLVKRGVSRTQLERIKNQQETSDVSDVASSEKSSAAIRRERRTDPDSELEGGDFDIISSEIVPQNAVFGRNIFNARNLTFNPSTNIPTPADYRLGPGDEVIIDVWGASQTSIRQTISPEGSIMVDRLGPIYLNGMTIKDANNYVQKKFSEVYAGIDSEGVSQTSQIKLTLGQIRTIQINIMGEVSVPGTYSLSSLSSVFHALYRAGGVSSIGSLRSIRLYRNDKLLHTLDVYQYIMKGKFNEDIRMTDGDVIQVPTYLSLIDISGNVKRPMFYELKPEEKLSDLIKYAGGFIGDAYTNKVRVTRSTGGENQIFTVNEDEYDTFQLKDKDVVSISPGLELFENRVEITGAVYRSGYYEIGKNINTIKELIAAADGLRGDAFLNRAILTRTKEDYTTEIIPVDIGKLSETTDIKLTKNDVLYIPSVHDLNEYGDFTIHGAVPRPGNYKYAENTTLEDLIVQAGGLLESASTVKVDIARRIIDPKSMTVKNTVSETFSFGLKDGFVVDGEAGFILKPYDAVYVRYSPSYRVQQNVFLSGELLFPGTYALNKKTERLSDVIKRAGNITPDAYLPGARLIRQRSAEEAFRTEMALKMARQGGKDSIAIGTLDMSGAYNIGIELDKALQFPRSDYDLVLREGDRLFIPEYENTVKINGAVMFPNTVTYKQGESLLYYINQAGGYADNAKKRRSFVIYMNGTVSRIKKYDIQAIKPGSEIIIPTKEPSRKITLQEVVSIGTSAVSVATMVTLLLNILNNK